MSIRKKVITAVISSAAIALTAFVSVPTASAATGFVGVILPDSVSSPRWETYDHPDLQKAFDALKVPVKIQNANGDKTQFQTIADQMLTAGAKVLVLAGLDSDTTIAVQTKAKAQGVPTIDYDRLTLKGSESYYVSFDNVKVGQLEGKGIANCLRAAGKNKANIVYLNGSPTDNNATLFKQGYDSIMRPAIKAGRYKLLADQAVPGWDPVQGATIFEQMFTKANGKIDAVVAANEGLGLAAVSILAKNGLNGKVCVDGQDASNEGLAAVLKGDLTVTVWKPYTVEANAAASAAAGLFNGTTVKTQGTVDNGTSKVPAVLGVPIAVTKANVKDVIKSGQTTRADVCKIAGEAACKANGI